MFLPSNDKGYMKLIEMDIEMDPDFPTMVSKAFALPIKYQEWVRKELEYLEKGGIIQRSLSPYACIVIVPRKCSPGSAVQETKRLFQL